MTGRSLRERARLIREVFRRLSAALGPQHWWPADTPFEVIAGAILTQNTAWSRVRQAIAALKDAQLLSSRDLHAAAEADLAPLIRPCGYYNQKTKRLKAFCAHLENHWRGDLDRFLAQEAVILRKELLGIFGIGPETADSVVLYAAGKPSFVVDAYTRRIFSRHGWVDARIGYEDLRRFFEACLPPDVEFFQELHALLVRTGNLHCRSRPLCESCPLHNLEA